MTAALAETFSDRQITAPNLAEGKSAQSRRKFLRFFPAGFRDRTYLSWERDYKWSAHEQWLDVLNKEAFRKRISRGKFLEIGVDAVKIESRTNLLFSFEKMAIRDASKSPRAARAFAEGLYSFLYSTGSDEKKFERWVETIAALPRRQSRVLTWPLVTVFPFMARPDAHIFLKPTVTRRASREYGYDIEYRPRPSWHTYSSLLRFAEKIRRDVRDFRPRDMIDLQSFIWVLGSDEYEE